MNDLINEEKEIVEKQKMLVTETLKEICDKQTKETINPCGIPFEVDVFFLGKYKIIIRFDYLECIYNEKFLSSIEFLNIDTLKITDKSIVFYCTNRTQQPYNKDTYKRILRRY